MSGETFPRISCLTRQDILSTPGLGVRLVANSYVSYHAILFTNTMDEVYILHLITTVYYT